MRLDYGIPVLRRAPKGGSRPCEFGWAVNNDHPCGVLTRGASSGASALLPEA